MTHCFLAPTAAAHAIAAPSDGDFILQDREHTLSLPSELVYRVSAKVLLKLPHAGAHKAVVVGSGGLSTGQAGKFSYSGSQGMKTLRKEGTGAVLINLNVVMWQTSHQLALEVYLLPTSVDCAAYVLEKERPDGILLAFSGQSAPSVSTRLDVTFLALYDILFLSFFVT